MQRVMLLLLLCCLYKRLLFCPNTNTRLLHNTYISHSSYSACVLGNELAFWTSLQHNELPCKCGLQEKRPLKSLYGLFELKAEHKVQSFSISCLFDVEMFRMSSERLLLVSVLRTPYRLYLWPSDARIPSDSYLKFPWQFGLWKI